MKLKGKQIVITGGSGGIGRAVAKKLLENGAEVLIASRSEAELAEAEKELSGAGKIRTAVLDVADEQSVAKLSDWVSKNWDGLDALVNAAAILGPIGPVMSIAPGEWRRAIDVDLTGTFLMVRAMVPLMQKRGRGKIINFVGGGDGARPNFSAYVSAKGGIARFTETVAAELKELNIEVNAIAPGAVNTKLLDEVLRAGKTAGKEYQQAIKQKEEGGVSPEKAADLILFLASEESDGISGKIFSAVWDKYRDLSAHLAELSSGDIYNYRRIKPEDRGKSW